MRWAGVFRVWDDAAAGVRLARAERTRESSRDQGLPRWGRSFRRMSYELEEVGAVRPLYLELLDVFTASRARPRLWSMEFGLEDQSTPDTLR